MTSSQALALKAKLRRDGLVEMRLRGRCVEPFLVRGDTVRIFSAKKIEIGDIRLVELEGTEIALHRIVAMKDDGILTKGSYSGLIEKRQSEHILDCMQPFRFRDANGRVDYLPNETSNISLLCCQGTFHAKRKPTHSRPGEKSVESQSGSGVLP